MRIAIQGERGSNSHMAALEMMGQGVEIVPCVLSADVMAAVVSGAVDGAVLPIENSLHGSVAEHYDLLLSQPVRVERESLLRIKFNVIAAPGVKLNELRRVMSHPVGLSQCRRWLAAHRTIFAEPFYDTAGSVKHVMEAGLRDTAGLAPELAAQEYGAEVLETGIEDNAQNFTRFHLVRREDAPAASERAQANKMSVAFAIENQPGTLARTLTSLAGLGVGLTKIESRPVPGSPWEYVFYADFRFEGQSTAEQVLAWLAQNCAMVKELGRYVAA
jgi:prephenate dehydratase